MKKVMAMASGGGHWVQLMRLRPAFDGQDVFYVCVQPSYSQDVPGARFYSVTEVTRWNRWAIGTLLLQLLRIFVVERPDVIITTGSGPAMIALKLGKLFGVRSMWIDSIANAEELSLSGKRAGKSADVWLTQWKHLSRPEGPDFKGSVF